MARMACYLLGPCALERSLLGFFASILLPLIHLLLKGSSLFLIRKREASETIF